MTQKTERPEKTEKNKEQGGTIRLLDTFSFFLNSIFAILFFFYFFFWYYYGIRESTVVT